MKKTLYAIWSKFLTAFGNIKFFKIPPALVYDPEFPQVSGEKTLQIMSLLKPGDIILRGYRNYLDGVFIPSKTGWSHGALYVGNNIVIHAVSKGVSTENIVEFTRCDRIAIFRPRKFTKSAINRAKKFLKVKTPYDFGFKRNVSALYCFELCAESYPKLDIRTKKISKFFGLVKKDVYIADSFFESKDLECIFQFNPQYNIDFVK